MLVYYSGGGAWCRASSQSDTGSIYNQLTAPSYISGVFLLPASAQQGITYAGNAEVTYLLPYPSHQDAAPLPKGEKAEALVFQLYAADNLFTEKVYQIEDVLNPPKSPDNSKKNNSKPYEKILSRRVSFIKEQLTKLEAAAEAKNIPFEKMRMRCSREELFEWAKSKKGSLFNNISFGVFCKSWKATKGYGLSHRSQVEKDFFTKIQG